MSTRKEAYAAIDTERNYQNVLSSDRTAGAPHQVGSYLTMMRHYLTRAEFEWTVVAGDVSALHEIRKLAAIAIRCMEDHGAFDRVALKLVIGPTGFPLEDCPPY